ncbi:MAG: hypothetical protein ACR2I2_16535 [Bryobacteraceae bacterium]
MAGTTGLEPATSDVTGIQSQNFQFTNLPIYWYLRGMNGLVFVGATVRASVLLFWNFDFFVDQLRCLIAQLWKQVLIAMQSFALVPCVFGDYVVRYTLAQKY